MVVDGSSLRARTCSRGQSGHGRRYIAADNRRLAPPLLACALAALLLSAAAGCGGSPAAPRTEEEAVADRALRAALSGERAEFVALVAPSFVAQARAEMPETDDKTLGGVLIAGFLEGVPFTGIQDAAYVIETAGDKADVYVWGAFFAPDGSEMEISEGDALRIPLIYEDGRWYLDLLDL